MNSPLFEILVKVTLFTMMLAIGVNLSWEKLTFLWRSPKKTNYFFSCRYRNSSSRSYCLTVYI